MSTIDERIVSMVFENAKFEAGVAKTMATLTKLDDSLKKIGQNNATASLDNIEKSANKVTLQGPLNALDKLRGKLFNSGKGATEGMSQIESAGNKVQLEQPVRALDKVQSKAANVGAGAAQSFSEIESASGKVSLQGLNAAMDAVTGKFSVMQGAAAVAMGNITSQAAMKGAAFGKSFAIGPLQQGFSEYQTNLGSIQTILANTEGQKVSGLDNVNKSLGELNEYSDQTIYNFSEMAKNIGTFTAAGVDLPRATSSIKGIANLAALSGSNSQQASTAMYQLSQAISAGRVGLQDWNSVVNAGMGGAVFQKSLMRTAENMGALEKGAVKIDKATGKATVNGESFRNSIMAKPGEESWLSSDVLTKTLEQMTGDMSDAELKAQGFSAAQIDAIQKQAKNAKDAATQVKTLPQVWDVARETIGSGWAQTSQLIFGNFKEAKKTFTELSNTVNGFINRMSDARNKVLKAWKAMGGRTELIEGLKTTFNAISQVLGTVNIAFRKVFPKQTGKDLYEFTKAFGNLADRLQSFVLQNRGALQNTFRGFFAVLHIGMAIVKGVAGVIADLLGVVGHGSGNFLSITASIGLWLAKVDEALTKGGLLTKVFDRISSVLQKPMELIGKLTSGISGLFSGVSDGKASKLGDSMDKVKGAAGPLASVLRTLKSAWNGFVKMLGQAKELVSPWLDKIGEGMSGVTDAIGKAFEGGNFDHLMTALQTGFIGGIFIVIKRAISGSVTELGGAVKGLNGVFGSLTDHLNAMQQKVKAQALLTIAAAIALLAAAALVLSRIPADDLAKAMAAMAVGMGQVMASMKILTGAGFGKGASLTAIATGMVLISAAMLILTAAMKVMSTMSWEEITKGFAGISGGLTSLGIGMKFVGPSALAYAPGILVLSVAMNALAIAVKIFATMKWETLARGLAGMLGALLAIGIGVAAIGPSILLTAPGILVLAVALNILAGAIAILGNLDDKTLVKGFLALTATLLILSEAMWAFPPGPFLIAQAAGMVILGVALQAIAVSLAMFGGLGIMQIIKGLVAMAGALIVLAGGLYLMEGTLPGAAALLVAAAGIAILAPAIALLGNLKWGTILKGLVAMAAGLALLAVAGTFAGPGIAALGGALMPLALVLLVGAGAIFLFAKALQVMGGAGSKGLAVMVAAITAFVALLPKIIIDFVKGLVEIIAEIVKIAPKVLEGIGKMISMIIAWVTEQAPKLAVAIGVLIGQFLKVINDNAPNIIIAGWALLQKFLSGIENNIGSVTTKAGNIIIKFLTALAAKAPDIARAGGELIIKFLAGIGEKAHNIGEKAANIVVKFIGGVVTKLTDLQTIGSRLIAHLILGLGKHVERLVTAGGQAVVHILTGIGKQIEPIRKKALWLARTFVTNLVKGLVGLADIGAQGLIDFLNGMAEVIRKRSKEVWKAGANLASAIMEGFAWGVSKAVEKPIKKIKKFVDDAKHKMTHPWELGSPSKFTMRIGGHIMDGFAIGIDRGTGGAVRSIGNAGDQMMNTMQQTMSNVPGLLDGIIDTDPTIKPVLDLSHVRKEAEQLDAIAKMNPFTAKVSLRQADAISREKATADQATVEMATAASKPSLHYEQTINSPEPLSTAEIYRRTNNTLSKIRKDVGLE